MPSLVETTEFYRYINEGILTKMWPAHFAQWPDMYNWITRQAAIMRKSTTTAVDARIVVRRMMQWKIDH
tara:strand:- start:121 stop:327 length:207 start_codon:yes stop_codon:yes gene_type:complete